MAVEDGSSPPPWVRTFFGPTVGWRNVPESEVVGGSILEFDDVPDSYVGQALKHLRVNAAETGIEFEAIAAAQATNWVYASDFGVVANNFTDDTAALNACFASIQSFPDASGTVVLPPGLCKTTDTVVVGTTSINGPQSHINIIGMGRSGINYAGPADRAALRVSRMTNFYFKNLSVWRNGAKGTTTGLELGGRSNPADFGNLTNNAQFYNCSILGFALGINAGVNFGASSELTFYSCGIGSNDVGFVANDFNSLDFNFYLCSIGENGIGLDSGVSGGYNVHGGSASNPGTNFMVRANALCIITGFRSETATRFVDAPLNGGRCIIESCSAVSPQAPDFISIGGHFGQLIVNNCILQGSITPLHLPSVLEVRNCILERWDTVRRLPVVCPVDERVMRAHAIFDANTDSGAFPSRQILNFQGFIGAYNNGSPPTTPFLVSTINRIPIDRNSVAGFATESLSLNFVRSLSEGIIGGAVAGTAPTPGKNLRVQGTLAAGTLAFTFVRSFSIQHVSGPLIAALGGATFKASDVGKRVKIILGSDIGTDWYGYVLEVLSTTTAHVFPGVDVSPGPTTPGWRYPTGNPRTIEIGENEPNANYLIAGLTSNVTESFGVTAISSTGFTVTSSNGASTATFTALIVR